MNPLLGIALVLVLFAALLAVLTIWSRAAHPHPELTRKILHIGMGLITLSFPWIFRHSWPVAVIAVLAILMLSVLRWGPAVAKGADGVLGGVRRESMGEFYFVAAVALVFFLSGGDPLKYCVPVLVLTLADAVGALVGARYGLSPYRTDEGVKSAEGSLAFFLVAFLSAHVPLLLFSDAGRAEVLMIGLVIGFLVMLIEAISWRGLDNLLTPVATFFLLEVYRQLSTSELVTRLAVMVGLTIFALLWRKKTTLNDSAAMAAAVFGYIVWALAGWRWVIAPFILFACYAQLSPVNGGKISGGDVQAVIRVMAGPLLWLGLALVIAAPALVVPYHATLAAHLAHITISRIADPARRRVGLAALVGCCVTAWLLLMLLPGFVAFRDWMSWQVAVGVLGVVILSGSVFNATSGWSRASAPAFVAWSREALIAPAASTFLFWFSCP
jgi:phytol kinase